MTKANGRRMETGHPVSADVTVLHGDTVRFVTESGRCQFEVKMVDEDAIEIIGIETYYGGKRLLGPNIVIEPRSAVAAIVRSKPYSE